MEVSNKQNLIWSINESLEREDVSAEQIDKWIGDNANNKNIPNYVWDIINAVYNNAEDDEDEDAPSWNEFMQDYYPSDDNGKVFDTESGF